jgi:hypothetical protein
MEKSLRLKSDGFEPFRLAAGTAAKGHLRSMPEVSVDGKAAPIAAIQQPTNPGWVGVTSADAEVSKRDTCFSGPQPSVASRPRRPDSGVTPG